MTPAELRFRRIASFRDLALQELQAAEMLSKTNPRQAVYFLQQCVEKLVRGILEVEGNVAGPTHDISQLASLVGSHADLVGRFKRLDELSPAATRFRYPGPQGNLRSISEADLKRLFVEVERLCADVVSILSLSLKDATP